MTPSFPLHNIEPLEFKLKSRRERMPSFAIIDGRDNRARRIDQEAEAWGRVYQVNKLKKPSEFKRENGLQLRCKFGIAVCTRHLGVRRRSGRFIPNSITGICGYLNVMKQGEKLPRCGGCHKRVWARLEDVIFQHDNLKVVKMVVSSVKGWQGRGRQIYRLPMSKLNEWARRSEKRIEGRTEVKHFVAHMPWNLEGVHTHGV